jgi:hypothetical protein
MDDLRRIAAVRRERPVGPSVNRPIPLGVRCVSPLRPFDVSAGGASTQLSRIFLFIVRLDKGFVQEGVQS